MTFKPGYLMHYKNNMYSGLTIATNSETLEPFVIYRAHKDNRLWVRPKENFEAPYSVSDTTWVERFEWKEPLMSLNPKAITQAFGALAAYLAQAHGKEKANLMIKDALVALGLSDADLILALS